MTAAQFAAFAQLTRLREQSQNYLCIRSVLVDGLSAADAAALHGTQYIIAYKAVAAARRNITLMQTATAA